MSTISIAGVDVVSGDDARDVVGIDAEEAHRWGLIKEHPDYLAVARQINQTEIYKQAASAAKVSVPKSDMRSSKFMDGMVWDGKDPRKYADSFKVHA